MREKKHALIFTHTQNDQVEDTNECRPTANTDWNDIESGIHSDWVLTPSQPFRFKYQGDTESVSAHLKTSNFFFSNPHALIHAL